MPREGRHPPEYPQTGVQSWRNEAGQGEIQVQNHTVEAEEPNPIQQTADTARRASQVRSRTLAPPTELMGPEETELIGVDRPPRLVRGGRRLWPTGGWELTR